MAEFWLLASRCWVGLGGATCLYEMVENFQWSVNIFNDQMVRKPTPSMESTPALVSSSDSGVSQSAISVFVCLQLTRLISLSKRLGLPWRGGRTATFRKPRTSSSLCWERTASLYALSFVALILFALSCSRTEMTLKKQCHQTHILTKQLLFGGQCSLTSGGGRNRSNGSFFYRWLVFRWAGSHIWATSKPVFVWEGTERCNVTTYVWGG